VLLPIFRQAVVSEDKVPPWAVPALVAAMRSAGATDAQLRELLDHIGSHPYLNVAAIIRALRQAGLESDAETVKRARGWSPR
jgi:hypothetical protein